MFTDHSFSQFGSTEEGSMPFSDGPWANAWYSTWENKPTPQAAGTDKAGRSDSSQPFTARESLGR